MTLGRSAILVLPAVPTLGIVLWWMSSDGGYDRLKWMPASVALVGLAAVALVLGGGMLRRSRPALIATGALGAYTAWSFLSITWADAPGPALEGSLRTLTYFAVWLIFASLPWTAARLEAATTAFALGVGVIGVLTILRVASAVDTRLHMIDARLAEPLSYQNANAALWAMAAFPALLLASRRATPTLARPFLLGAATVCFGLGTLAQSRGWLFGLPIIALAMVAAAPGRARLLLATVPVAAGVAFALPELLDVYAVGGGRVPSEAVADVRVAFDEAARALLIATTAVTLAGVVLVLADRRVRLSSAAAHRGSQAVGALAIAGALAACAVGLAATDGDPAGKARDAWAEFKDFESDGTASANRFGNLGSGRYDIWRVSLEIARDRPLAGIGQDNFAQPFLRLRASSIEEPRWTHSLPLRLLVHTGVIGLLLFAIWTIAALWGALRRPRTPEGIEQRAVAVGAAMPLVVWLVHGSVDWLWEYPALSAAAIGLVAGAGAIGEGRLGRPLGRVAGTGTVLIALVAAFAYVPPFLAERHIQRATEGWPYDAPWAYDQLERSQGLHGLSSQAWLIEGTIALQLKDYARARSALEYAARREPEDWVAHFQLGQVATAAGERRRARQDYRAALKRNPQDPFIQQALRRLDSGSPIDPGDATEEFRGRADRRQGRG